MNGSVSDFGVQAKRECEARRARVLAHPDIAKRLCDFPLRASTPEMWTGFVPPAEVPTVNGWKRNESPIRRQIIAILKAVEAAENELEV